MNQIFQSGGSIRANLDEVAELLSEVSPDVVALQEADGPSFWSGRFDHVEYLARRAGFPHFARGSHVDTAHLSYGTALLSRYPFMSTRSVTFPPSPPTFSKGFVVSEVSLAASARERSPRTVCVVSVHLDFSRRSVREKQILDLIESLKSVDGPLIVMGDFNCEWSEDEATLKTITRKLDLQVFAPKLKALATFPLTGRRIDWILISRELRFESYQVIPERVSDHLATLATVSYGL